MRRCGAASMWRDGASGRRPGASGWPGRRCARCCATACRPGIVGRNRSGVRNWTPSPGSSIKSSPTISSARRNNGTRPSASGSAYASSTPSRAATRLSKTTCAGRSWAGKRCSCRSRIRRATPRPTSAKPWWSSTASNARRTTWSWICRTATTRSCRRFRPRRRRRFARDTTPRSATSAACRVASSTTTPRWRWRRFSGTARGSERRASASSTRTTCSTIASDGRGRATTSFRLHTTHLPVHAIQALGAAAGRVTAFPDG